MDQVDLVPFFLEDPVEVTERGPPERIDSHPEAALALMESGVIQESGNFLPVRRADRLFFPQPFRTGFLERNLMESGRIGQQRIRPILDLPGRLRQRRAAPGWGELQAVPFGRVMAGGNVDPSGKFS